MEYHEFSIYTRYDQSKEYLEPTTRTQVGGEIGWDSIAESFIMKILKLGFAITPMSHAQPVFLGRALMGSVAAEQDLCAKLSEVKNEVQ